MLTVKDNISVKTITFDFIRSSRTTTIDSQVTVPLNSFCDLELTTIDSQGEKREYRVRFKSQDGIMVDTYVVNEDTFNLLYKVFALHNYVDEHINMKEVITCHDLISDNDITIFKEDLESVSCVTYRNNEEIYKVELVDDIFRVTKEDYCYLKKMLKAEKED